MSSIKLVFYRLLILYISIFVVPFSRLKPHLFYVSKIRNYYVLLYVLCIYKCGVWLCGFIEYRHAVSLSTFLKSRTFSVVNHWVLRGQCDRLRNFMTLFVINLALFQVLIADNFGIFCTLTRKTLWLKMYSLTWAWTLDLLHDFSPLYHAMPIHWSMVYNPLQGCD